MDVLIKTAEPNIYGLPRGEQLRRAVRSVFAEQRAAVLRYLRTGTKELSDPLPIAWPDWHDFGLGAIDLQWRMTPLLTLTWDAAAAKFAPKVGLDPSTWEVINPHTEAMIDAAALAFCDVTNSTTMKTLNVALAKTREELRDGVINKGESIERLTKRINAVFESAEKWRARRIAQTETSRAVHAAQEQTAIASGVVTGWAWLLSSDACPLCNTIARRAPAVRIGQPFAVLGDSPAYQEIRFPPAHPHCNCTVVEILDSDEQPEWAQTLDQPKPEEPDHKEPNVSPYVPIPRAMKPTKPKPAKKPKPKPVKPKRPNNSPKTLAEMKQELDRLRKQIPGGTTPGATIKERLDNDEIGKLKIKLIGQLADKAKQDAADQLKQVDQEADQLEREIEEAQKQYEKALRAYQDALARKDPTYKIVSASIKESRAERKLRKLLDERRELTVRRESLKKPSDAELLELLTIPTKDQHSLGWKDCNVGAVGDSPLSAPATRVGKRVTESLTWVQRLLRREAPVPGTIDLSQIKIGTARKARAHVLPGLTSRSPYHMQLDIYPRNEVIIHETGHLVECYLQGSNTGSIMEVSKQFLAYRTAGESPVKMADLAPGHGFDENEVGFEDDFAKAFGGNRIKGAYTGKRYRSATEILSMGFQLMHEDLPGFAQRDPEWCQYCLGILEGNLR